MRLPPSLIPLALLIAVALPGCAQLTNRGSGVPSLTASELIALEKLEPLPANRPIQIEAKFFDGAEVIAAPSVVALNGQTAAVEIAAEVSYPSRYTLAKAQSVDGANFPITPATPANFKTAPTGLSLKITPQIRDAFIELSGSVIFSWSEGNTTTASVGEGIGSVTSEDRRVTLTDNRHDLPVFGTRTTPFFIRALPGKTYTLKVKGEKGPIRIDITPTLRAPDKGDIANSRPDLPNSDDFRHLLSVR
jgi:hypothetical protein